MLRDIKHKRILKELSELYKNKIENVYINTNSNDITKIDFILFGEKNTPFENGVYYIKLILNNFPFEAPDILILTPNGKFLTDVKICISGLTNFHKSEWCHAISLENLIEGFKSFMYSEDDETFIGKYHPYDVNTIKYFAKESLNFNLKIYEFVNIFNNYKNNIK